MKPIISIITPTYNHEKYISRCLDSVRNQSFSKWELIVINDGSTDNTAKIISAYLKNDNRIKMISHTHRKGIAYLSHSYNEALERAKGTFIAVLEGDDFWPSYKLEKQLNSFKDDKVILSYGDWVMTNQNGTPIKVGKYIFDEKLLQNIPTGSIVSLFSSLKFFIITSTLIIRKKTLLSIGGFKKDNCYPFIDIPTLLHLSLKGKFYYQKELLGFYRKHSDSVWFNYAKNTDAMLRGQIQTCTYNFWKSHQKELTSKKIQITKNDLLSQRKIIAFKHKRKYISILLHYFIFNDYRNMKRFVDKIIKSNNELLTTKVLAIFIYLLFPFLTPLSYLFFLLQFFIYKLSQNFTNLNIIISKRLI